MLFSKNHIAKVINRCIQEGKFSLRPNAVAPIVGSQDAVLFIQEAVANRFLDNNWNILRNGVNSSLLTGKITEAEAGDLVTVIRNGKSHEAVVSGDDNGKYRLAFTDEAPDDHDEEKDYSDTDFGVKEEED